MDEEAALDWFQELGYPMIPGPPHAPGDPAADSEALGEGELEG